MMKRSSKLSKKTKIKMGNLWEKLTSEFSSRTNKIILWIMIGGALAIMPLFYQITFDWISGLHVEIAQILPDYILVAFAITGNLFGMILDNEKLKDRIWGVLLWFLLIPLLTFSIYLKRIISYSLISNGTMIMLLIFATIYNIAIIILGIFIIIKKEKSDK